MATLFEETAINGMVLKNRFVRSATFEAMADADGGCTENLIALMQALARGEVGLIITGYAYMSRIAQSRAHQLGVYSDALLPGLRRMVEAVHSEGGKLVMQMVHTGCNSFVVPEGAHALGPSAAKLPQGCATRAMTEAEIRETVEDFVNAAVRAKKAGFDGVQLHGAHGYLISQFLSPFYNKRSDAFGGNLANRSRFLLALVKEIRAAVGAEYPVMAKINSDDFLPGGFGPDEMLEVASMLETAGIDAVEISGGTHLSPEAYSFSRKTGIVPENQELYFRDAAERYKEKIRVPLMLVGGIRSYRVAEQVVADGLADYVSLCRPLIREPGLIARWRFGDDRRADCISCNGCFKPVRAGKALYCVAEEKLRRTKTQRIGG